MNRISAVERSRTEDAVAHRRAAGGSVPDAVDLARHNGGQRREGLDIGMLTATALAAVAAAVVTSKLWPGGTLISTAMTPVIVALVKEWLRKPAERISAVSAKAPHVAARVVTPARGAPDRGEAARAGAAAPSVARFKAENVLAPAPGSPAAGTPAQETFVETAPASRPSHYRLYRRRAMHWRLAAVTGLLGFVVAALLITLPELVFGGAVAGKGATTVFGGGSQHPSHGMGDGQNNSRGERSGDRRATSTQQPTPKPKTSSTSTQPPAASPAQPSTQQSPAARGTSPQSTPAPPSSGQSSPGPGPASPPPGGQ